MQELNDKNSNLKERTKRFAIRIVNLVKAINENNVTAAKVIANGQLLRSGTAVAANYRAACRSKSRKDFISKISTVVEEADETQFWLEILVESGLIAENLVIDLLRESGELTAIMTKSKETTIRNQYTK